MEVDEPEAPDGSKICVICSKPIENPEDDAVSIFNKGSQTCSDRPLNFIMSQVLAQNIEKSNVHSDLMCKVCFKTFDEVDELERKLQQQKIQLMNKYRKSLKLASAQGDSGADDADQTMKIITIKPDVAVEEEEETSEKQETLELNVKSLDTLEDIENQLVKMHGEESTEEEAKEDETHFEIVNSTEPLDIQLEVAEILNAPKSKKEVNKIKLEATSNSKEETNEIEEDLKPSSEAEDEDADQMVIRNGNTYTCLLCEGDETVCGLKRDIGLHIKLAHQRNIYFCDLCGNDFGEKAKLQAHMRSHEPGDEGEFQCETCNRIYNSFRLFQVHKRTHCKLNKVWKCSYCDKSYSSSKLLEEHENMHSGNRPYTCKVCNKSFASKYTSKAHERIHEYRPRNYQCKDCDKTFMTAKNLAQHEKLHSGIKEYVCQLCNKRFASSSNLEVHSVVHTGYRPYICGLCGKAFARKAEIRDHERTHTGERPYQCDLCGSTFSQRSNLQSHKRATHYDDKRYKCTKCDKAFKRRRLLDYHTKSAHTGERPYKCTVCNATFVYPEHFKKHSRIHTGEKPFKCEICGKAFNNRDNRNAHRFVHSDKKPYECLVCGSGFMRKPLLYQHMQSEGHLNDTIVVNQPRLSEDHAIVMFTSNGDVQLLQQGDVSPLDTIRTDEDEADDTKVYLNEQVEITTANKSTNELILGDNGEDSGGDSMVEDQKQAMENDGDEEVEMEEETILANVEDLQGILTPEAIAEGHTQIIQTKDGPIRLLAVKISNDKGEEEETWIKILPDPE